MKFRNNRFPYMFPAWIGGQFAQMQVNDVYELTGTVVEELDDRYVIDLDQSNLNDSSDAKIRIEWLKECMEVIES